MVRQALGMDAGVVFVELQDKNIRFGEFWKCFFFTNAAKLLTIVSDEKVKGSM